MSTIEIAEPNGELAAPLYAGSNVLSYALVNEARHEALPLTARGTSNGNSWLVLPGNQMITHSLSLDTRDALVGQTPPVDDHWYSGARVWVVDWLPVETYPVRATLTWPQPASGGPEVTK